MHMPSIPHRQLTCNVTTHICFVTSADDASDVLVRHLESLFLRGFLMPELPHHQ